MGQFGFFDADRRLAAITAKGDPLEMIDRVVPFESFRAEIEVAVLTPVSEKKSSAGRKPIDVMVMFRMLVLQSLYNLSDEQVEYQAMARLLPITIKTAPPLKKVLTREEALHQHLVNRHSTPGL
jgi:IS5 family transposase